MIARLVISPSLEKVKEEAAKILASKLATERLDHPDILYFPFDSKLGIEQARKIKDHLTFKPYSAKGRGVVLEDATTLTPEAQNALLKTFEEPPNNAVLILGASSDSKFLPTILSRVQIIRLQEAHTESGKVDRVQSEDYEKDIEKLLSGTIEERFEYIEKLKEKEEFLYSLTRYFHQKLPKNSEFLKQVLQAGEWVNQNVNIRAILEYLMLKMPKR